MFSPRFSECQRGRNTRQGGPVERNEDIYTIFVSLTECLDVPLIVGMREDDVRRVEVSTGQVGLSHQSWDWRKIS